MVGFMQIGTCVPFGYGLWLFWYKLIGPGELPGKCKVSGFWRCLVLKISSRTVVGWKRFNS